MYVIDHKTIVTTSSFWLSLPQLVFSRTGKVVHTERSKHDYYIMNTTKLPVTCQGDLRLYFLKEYSNSPHFCTHFQSIYETSALICGFHML